jgi:hypothetical protein
MIVLSKHLYLYAVCSFLGMVEATIEDSDIPTVFRGYLTKSDGGAVLSTT